MHIFKKNFSHPQSLKYIMDNHCCSHLLSFAVILTLWTGASSECYVSTMSCSYRFQYLLSVSLNMSSQYDHEHTISTSLDMSGSYTTRTRRPWHALSDEDQMLYVLGFQELAREGVLNLFVESHERATEAANNIHLTSQNFFWHSYWLWELENSFRNLGPEYECFAMPYWDVTNDADAWSKMDPSRDIDDLPIYNANLGANGIYSFVP